MSKNEWHNTSDVVSLLRWAVPRASKRKLQLYRCGGCRQIAHLFYDETSFNTVEVAERDADGEVDEEELHRASWAGEVPTFGYDYDDPAHDGSLSELITDPVH